ncbi:MAG: hypothetical protein NT086_19700 [Proteobacteria bacterium]|nr:hypothetical protein [Pseudomonadota bacterium]
MSLLITAAELLEAEAKIIRAANSTDGEWEDSPDAIEIYQKWLKTAAGLRAMQSQLYQLLVTNSQVQSK